MKSSDRLQERFKDMIYGLAMNYDKELDDFLYRSYFRVCFPVVDSEKQMIEVYDKILNNKAYEYMPRAAEIKALFTNDNLSVKSNAIATIEKIKYAVSKYGYMRGSDAMKYLGPLAWKLVTQKGGWRRVCENSNFNEPAINAQFRDEAQALIEQVNAGQIEIESIEQIEQKRGESLKLLKKIKKELENGSE